ncbi:DUF6538 domain-containing protein [Methylobacterium sp. 13MFTsu3.1M2]|uniref:DUF6538 domain-containing protein n=1 Tax=Methylobacterium sp. 13MFTsu3.1M2 TaxID=1502776 RepID=UPI0008E21B51|nr:DUF6538 domain-containing protein [Methylobacterium sp. 13MFTsu3.1M2]SFE88060.1 Site-specific recombinase XerD [Methylobacterium sp. 13MFTsu3.1M2]
MPALDRPIELAPWLHPESGRYYYRRRVPSDLVEFIGSSHVKRSLKTKDLSQAKREFEKVHREIEERWQGIRRGVRALTWEEIASIGGAMYDLHIDRFKKSKFSIHGHSFIYSYCGYIINKTKDEYEIKLFNETVGRDIDVFLDERGILVSPRTRKSIDYHVATAVAQAIEVGFKWFGGDFSPDPKADRFPRHAKPSATIRALDTFDHYAKEAELSPATRKRWEPVFVNLVRFVGHDDLARIDADRLADWLDHLRVDAERKAVTIRDVYLASVRAVYGWLVVRRKLKENPARDLKVKIPAGHDKEMREFSDAEACRILSASLGQQPDDLKPHLKAARRWVPWLCAYTGARVNEITQLRREDVFEDEGIWIVHVTPDAGRVKDRTKRKIPLHPHLVRQGFIRFVAGCPEGALFYVPIPPSDLPLDPIDREVRTAERFKRTGEDIAVWVRSLGIVDRDVGPSHGWRHRFKTEGRRAGMKERMLDAIQGHASRTKADRYGSRPPSVLFPEILKLVPYVVDGTRVTVTDAPAYVYDYGSDDAEASAEAFKAERRKAG